MIYIRWAVVVKYIFIVTFNQAIVLIFIAIKITVLSRFSLVSITLNRESFHHTAGLCSMWNSVRLRTKVTLSFTHS